MSEDQLTALGFDESWHDEARRVGASSERVARVARAHGAAFGVLGDAVELEASLAGRLEQSILEGDAERPAVGDWVVLRDDPASERVIESVLPRRTKIARRAAGRATREQVVAANVDVVFVVCALGRDVNERRIERFTAVIWDGGATPVVLLNKADLFEAADPYVERVRQAAPGAAIHLVSALTGAGIEALADYFAPGRTLALIGSSGAGKTTLLNRWLAAGSAPELARFETGELRRDGKGRHTTTSRQLVRLASGALVIDTPGLREVGLWAGEAGLDRAFEELTELVARCRFSDCRHEAEPGCAVLAAVETGQIDPARVDAYRRLQREREFVERRADATQNQVRRAQARSQTRALRKRLRDKGRV